MTGGEDGEVRGRRPERREPERSPRGNRPPQRAGRAERVERGRPHRLLGLASTRRAAVLALVVCALVLSVAVPLRNYLAQRGELDETVRQQEQLREQVDGLERRKAELQDPAQVEVEARERLRYVRPGETPYVVQLPSSTPAPPPAQEPRAGSVLPWYDQLWSSVAAGRSG